MPLVAASVVRLAGEGLPAGVREVEHTADAAIEAEGATLEECFARAAAGMFATFVRPGSEAGEDRVLDVDVAADGLGELLLTWLEELLYRAEVGSLALHTFEVTEVAVGRVRGRVRGRPLDGGELLTGPTIKAVTRHGLAVRRAGGRWRAHVIFDV
jgi:SHS2 domain-containing protein